MTSFYLPPPLPDSFKFHCTSWMDDSQGRTQWSSHLHMLPVKTSRFAALSQVFEKAATFNIKIFPEGATPPHCKGLCPPPPLDPRRGYPGPPVKTSFVGLDTPLITILSAYMFCRHMKYWTCTVKIWTGS